MNNFDQYISETGFLTKAGKEIADQTINKGLNEFLTALSAKEMSIQQLRVIKAIVLNSISEKMINATA